MGIRETALSKRSTKKWNDELTDDQANDLDTLVKMVQDGEISATVAFFAWDDHHPGLCKKTTFLGYLRELRGEQ